MQLFLDNLDILGFIVGIIAALAAVLALPGFSRRLRSSIDITKSITIKRDKERDKRNRQTIIRLVRDI